MTETTFFLDPNTPPAVAMALGQAYRSQDRIRVWIGDPETGEAWPEEWDVTGRVGRSTGPRPAALLIPTASSLGGAALLTRHLVRIDTTAGRTLYQHPTFTAGDWRPALGEPGGDTWNAMHNGKPWAADLTREQAYRLCAFMRGDRYCE